MNACLVKFSALRLWPIPLAHQYYANAISLADGRERMVFSKKERFTMDGKRTSICTSELPANSIAIRDGIKVSTPGFTFLQFAQIFDIIETIILGDLLCSKPKGPLSRQTICKSELLTYVLNAKGIPGRKRALRALQYIKDDACSVMEVFVDLFLGLPSSLGGIGLKGGIFNHEVVLDKENAKAIGQDRCYIDYCFPLEKIAYEYQGAVHNTSVDQDSNRMTALSCMNYRVITISKSQLYNREKLQQLIKYVTKTHNFRIRQRNKSHESHFERIHALLPRYNQ